MEFPMSQEERNVLECRAFLYEGKVSPHQAKLVGKAQIARPKPLRLIIMGRRKIRQEKV